MNQAQTATAQPEAQRRPDPSTRGSRPAWLPLAIVLIAAAILRLLRLGDDSFWDNEILSHERATAGLGDAYDLIREGTHPPGYSQVILRPWLALGDSEFMQRLPSVVFGVASIAITARLATRLGGREAGIVAAIVAAVMPLNLYYSREGRMYALLALVLVAWIAALIEAYERDTWRSWAIYAALGAAALYTHYYAGFTVLSVVGVTGAYELRNGFGPRTRRWVLATGAIGVAFVPWLPTFRYQLSNDPVSHLEALGVRGVAELPIQFFTAFADRSPIDNLVIAAALLVLTATALHSLWVDRTADGGDGFAAAIVVGAVFGTIALSVLVSMLRPLIFVRYFVGILPMVAVLLAVGVTRRRLVAGAAMVALLAASLAHAVPTIADTWRPDFKAATDLVETTSPDDSIVLLVGPDASDFRVRGFWYYLDPAYAVLEVTGATTDPVFVDALEQLDDDITTVWVVQYQTLSAATAYPPGFTPGASERFDSRFFTGQYPVSVQRIERSDA